MTGFFRITPLLLFLALAGCAIGEAARKEAAYHYQMGLSYLVENNVTGALIELTEAEKLTPDDPELLNYLGLAYYRKGRFEIAESKYMRALDLKHNYSDARNNLGVTYMEMKRWDEAIREFKVVTDDIFYRDQGSATINLGLAYFGKGDLPKALSVLRSATSANPRDPRAHLHLGRVYLAQDKTELAIGAFKRAIDLQQGYVNAYYNLGLAYIKNMENGNAKDAFRMVMRLAPDSEIGQLSREHIDTLK
ncbi:lipopolysaccharide assembly protein LapB [Geobacter sp. DSM 9736]|uniref:tetratricopeptide repeat protein n=1 Tax=Geobacter sp. DSM 9736 TaxID=1277350 RepID=UPI000B50B897|nr:tetratricopeptide repeat protein [Geobacter sp. DSM 9736]SNB44885.1 Tfp pilus assembly protein PilF [Geobacter sp. DSM 9736]